VAKKGKTTGDSVEQTLSVDGEDSEQDFSSLLIRELNRNFGEKIAYNLEYDEAPSNVKRWISTGSRQLDLIIANKRGGGVPEGRVVEIFGPPSIGKSHLAYQMARNTQAMGGLVVYIDTENATSVEHLRNMGINVSRRFVFCESHMTEQVFSIMDSTIVKAKQVLSKDVPILVIWDSVAATSPKQELEGEYDKDTIGLNARVISKGMRKIIGLLGQNNVTLVCLNQIRQKVGGFILGDACVDPETTRVKLKFSDQSKFAELIRRKEEKDGK
jgi:recombination protein RecA